MGVHTMVEAELAKARAAPGKTQQRYSPHASVTQRYRPSKAYCMRCAALAPACRALLDYK